MEPKHIIIALAIVAGVMILAVINRRREQKRLLSKIREQWGKPGTEDLQEERFRTISAYLDSLPKRKTDVDDITWNDLELWRLYRELNTTQSAVGEEYLYSMLRRPETEPGPLSELSERIRFFSEHRESREELSMAFAKMGKLRAISLYEYLSRISDVKPKSNVPHYLGLLAYAVGLACFPLGNAYFGIVIVLFTALYQILTYYQRKGEIEPYLLAFSYLFRWLAAVEKICRTQAAKQPVIKEDAKQMADSARVFSALRRGSWLLASTSPTGSLSDMIMDYIRMLFHVDLLRFHSMYRFLLGHQEDLNSLFALSGRLDAAIAIASYRRYKEQWCEPKLTENGELRIVTEEMYHPLISEPVKNSIQATRPVLLTGSNASGKSTFLKMIALNALLSQTIYTVFADRYQSRYWHIMSSMALRDNLELGESYYIVEIKSIKRILDATGGQIPVLCFVDEVLRGTNTAERIAASSRILRDMARRNALTFAATHDLELTDILAKYYDNYHFSEQIVGQDVVFNYLLQKGKATSRNAIRLLRMLGYPESIILEADAMVEKFLETGSW